MRKPHSLHRKADASLGRAHNLLVGASKEIRAALDANAAAKDVHEAAIERHEAALVTARNRHVEAGHLLERIAGVV